MSKQKREPGTLAIQDGCVIYKVVEESTQSTDGKLIHSCGTPLKTSTVYRENNNKIVEVDVTWCPLCEFAPQVYKLKLFY